MNYTQKVKLVTQTSLYIKLSREELLELIRENLSQKRYDHVLRVEKIGLQLAEQYGESLEKTSIACLLHDLKKQEDDQTSRQTIISENLPLNLLDFGNSVWHGPVAAVYAEKQLDVSDEDILNAIKNHTVGSEHMSVLEKIVFVADYIEPARSFAAVEKARKLAEESLDAVIGYASQQTLKNLLESKKKIYPQTILTYNKYLMTESEEI